MVHNSFKKKNQTEKYITNPKHDLSAQMFFTSLYKNYVKLWDGVFPVGQSL